MPDSIGTRLKQAREALHITLDKAAEATRIRTHYLQALENDDYSVMSSAAQGRGFLRIYADYLGLNLEQLTADLRAAAASTPLASDAPAPVPPAEPLPRSALFWSRLTRRPASESSPVESFAVPMKENEPRTTVPVPEPVTVEQSPAVVPVPEPETDSQAKAASLVEETSPAPVRKPRVARKSAAAKSKSKSARDGKAAAKKKPAGKPRPSTGKKPPVKKNSKSNRRLKG